ncbi:glycosyltransferase family 4 protein [Achromobacter xylosoxidans]|uniref:glycosyltransferase family 4 protein n=2 Tax=Alcaligenes xylosoxydans xylosoxydans TaxID=85698 RepID=UPI0006C4BC1C|nr:glycosyltransferase family 1 protein [Achromobacter xylosoxidans]CUJ14527.1 D-inositol-3-phosphate glycosyltransferase [Achromobacter xylosoxidans]
MKKIAIISEHASPLAVAGGVDSGGQNVYVAHVARELARAGLQVDVFTRKDNRELEPEHAWMPGVKVVHVPAGPEVYLPKEQMLPYMDDFSRYLLRHAARQDKAYDIIHANFFMSAWAALPLAQRYGIPLAVTFHALGKVRRQHQQEADLFPDSRFDIETEIVRRADRIIAECPQDRRDLMALYDADPRRIDIVPCGYDAAEMAPRPMTRARQALGWEHQDFTLLQLGRMVPRKGVDNVIRALGRLRHRHGINARLCVVGGNSDDADATATPEIARLRQIAQDEGVAPWVEFTGRRHRDDLATYYGACDVFVTTPWYEPFGITPVEAMACGRPVVGSDTGGIRSTVVHGKTGFLVPPRDPDSLAERLAQLVADPALRARMGEAGRLRARRLYTWKRVGLDLLAVYRQMAAQAARPDRHAPRMAA